ncbi:hypothetical protein H5410_035041 [Solanum commersonii]|uniref:Uncharacterized protein n=1 Tax=Solanum commersonii TaxID=4109 RepID=A0A9J5Y047_SOLCO|nr:hypothetical protein H5410_035041 [Solanum commersonii]
METKINGTLATRGKQKYQFFHKMANAHKRSNNIDQLMIEDEPVMDSVRIREEIIGFYQKLYSENTSWRPSMCAMDKAPGPDGFTMGFYIKCWDVVKRGIMETFKNFHSQGVFDKSFNATYIALIQRRMELRN